VPAAEGVSAEATSVQDSSPESTSADPTKNLKAEFNRKLSKMQQQMDNRLQQILQAVTSPTGSQANAPAEKADFEEPEYKRYVDARFQESHKEVVKQGQESAWQKALELFPELNQDSDTFDEKFYKVADKYYGSFDLTRDPDAPLKAVKLAALEIGKIEQLTKERLLKDDARRSRLIAEGAGSPRDAKREKPVQLNVGALAKLGIKDPKKLEERVKAMKKQGES
jgi:hypothetical protein